MWKLAGRSGKRELFVGRTRGILEKLTLSATRIDDFQVGPEISSSLVSEWMARKVHSLTLVATFEKNTATSARPPAN